MPRSRETTVAASLIIDVAGYLERRGSPMRELCRRLDLDPALLAEPNRRLPGRYMERLWEEAERITGDPDLGLHTAESHNPGALNIVGYVVLSCRSAREALEALARYAALLNDGLRVNVAREGELTHCRCSAVPGLDKYLDRAPRQVMEAMACGIVLGLRRSPQAPLLIQDTIASTTGPFRIGPLKRYPRRKT